MGGAGSSALTTTAWIVICGWMAILAGGGYIVGTQIEAVIQLNNPSFAPQRWQGTLLFWAAVVLAVLINTVFGKLLPPIEATMLVVHVLGFFAVLIPLVYVRSFPYIPPMTSLFGAGYALEVLRSRITIQATRQLSPRRCPPRKPRVMKSLRLFRTEEAGRRKDCPSLLVLSELYLPCLVGHSSEYLTCIKELTAT